jgi:hypothetical protein
MPSSHCPTDGEAATERPTPLYWSRSGTGAGLDPQNRIGLYRWPKGHPPHPSWHIQRHRDPGRPASRNSTCLRPTDQTCSPTLPNRLMLVTLTTPCPLSHSWRCMRTSLEGLSSRMQGRPTPCEELALWQLPGVYIGLLDHPLPSSPSFHVLSRLTEAPPTPSH